MRRTAAVLAIAGVIGAAHAESGDGPTWSLSGFGTLGAVTTDEREADFVATHVQPHGAGYSQRIAFGPDSKLGLQLDAGWGPWSAVLQAVSQLQPNGTYAPHVEWANVKYQISPDLHVRAGRVALPVLMQSDYRLVGLANTTIRPPLEAYSIIPDTSITGVDGTWRHAVGAGHNSIQALYGSFATEFPYDGSLRVPHSWGLSDWLELGPFTLHAAFASASLVWHDPQSDRLAGAIAQYGELLESIPGLGPEGSAALGLLHSYNVYGQSTHLISAGATYDKDSWFAVSEWIHMTDVGFIPQNTGAYVTVGYRIGPFMPYATLATLKTKLLAPASLSPAGLPPPLAQEAGQLDGDVQGLIFAQNASQDTKSVGLRVELRSNMDLKLQADRIDLGAGALGQLANWQPGFEPGSRLYAYALAVDFVF